MLSLDDLETYPVWTWDNEHEGLLPISDDMPAPEDYEALFIKSNFKTNNHTFQGYIVMDVIVYAFGIFIQNKLFAINLGLTKLTNDTLKEIFQEMKCEPFDFFPIFFKSSVHLKEKKELSGTLIMKNEKQQDHCK